MKKNYFYNFCAFIFRIFMYLRFNLKIKGKSNIPNKGKVILVANHQSNYDFISLAIGTKRNVHFMAKNNLFKGVLKLILNKVEAIPVKRNENNKLAFSKALEVLNRGEVVGLFPEGTFNKTEELLGEFKTGAIRLALESGAPIIPITIIGPYKRNKLQIIIDKPFKITSNIIDKENNKLRKTIIKNLGGNCEYN